ncbi:hypothetical protein ACIA8K_07160 [Catenuloplanes sp. NPDC051500]|uniref:hypothetical protein n=1 Tax=Catenuloplanes sp. NPDC051500 TaxID=3363959 RepID=UPI0037B3E09F
MHEHTGRLIRRLTRAAEELDQGAVWADTEDRMRARRLRAAAYSATSAAERLGRDFSVELSFEAYERYDLLAVAAECGGWIGNGHPDHRTETPMRELLRQLEDERLVAYDADRRCWDLARHNH